MLRCVPLSSNLFFFILCPPPHTWAQRQATPYWPTLAQPVFSWDSISYFSQKLLPLGFHGNGSQHPWLMSYDKPLSSLFSPRGFTVDRRNAPSPRLHGLAMTHLGAQERSQPFGQSVPMCSVRARLLPESEAQTYGLCQTSFTSQDFQNGHMISKKIPLPSPYSTLSSCFLFTF
jgi:hypothetical protein